MPETRVSVAGHEPPLIKVEEWQPWDGPLGKLPRTRKEVYDVYGNPGVGKVDKKWERANMVLARNLEGAPRGKLYCHKLAEPYIREGLRRGLVSCPNYVIEKLGCFNFRHQRHDPGRGNRKGRLSLQ